MGRPILSARFLSTYAANTGSPYPFPPSAAATTPAPACPPAPSVQATSLPPPPRTTVSEDQALDERVYKWSEKPFDPDAELAEGYVWEAFLSCSAASAAGPKTESDPAAAFSTTALTAESQDRMDDDDARELLRDISVTPSSSPQPMSEAEMGEEEEEQDEDLEFDLTLDLSDDEEEDPNDELAGVDVLELARRAEAFVRAQQQAAAAVHSQQPQQILLVA